MVIDHINEVIGLLKWVSEIHWAFVQAKRSVPIRHTIVVVLISIDTDKLSATFFIFSF